MIQGNVPGNCQVLVGPKAVLYLDNTRDLLNTFIFACDCEIEREKANELLSKLNEIENDVIEISQNT